MGRTSRKTENTTVEEKVATVVQEEQVEKNVSEVQVTEDVNTFKQAPETPSDKTKDKEEIPPRVVELMRLYPHYEELWITSNGFVHPVGTPKYILKDATLYKNKFYNK